MQSPLYSTLLRSRGSTKRSDSCPMGDLNSPAVRLGNLLTARTIVILMILAAQGVWFALEQPSSSLMEKHVLFQRLVGLVSIRRMSIMMGDFAGPTLKPTWLYSSNLARSYVYIHIYLSSLLFIDLLVSLYIYIDSSVEALTLEFENQGRKVARLRPLGVIL